MSKENSIAPKIPAATFTIAIITIAASIYKYGESEITRTLKSLIEPFNLSWFDEGWGYYLGYTVNYFHLFFGCLLLIGGFISIATKHRDTTLIRFVFSVIFLSRIIAIVFGIIHWLFIRENEYRLVDHFTSACFILICLGYLLLSYRAIQYFNNKSQLETISYGEGEAAFYSPAPLSKWARLFNFTVDNLIGILLFTPIIMAFAHISSQTGGFNITSSPVTGKVIFYIIVFCSGTMYFFLSEWLLGASPAKFLTGARVADDAGLDLTPARILRQTVSRFIPFDGLSFIFSTGWHDTLSRTVVAKEIQTGISKGLYFIIIPLTLFVGYAGSLFNVKIKAEQEEQAIVDKTVDERKNFDTQLSYLDTKDFLALKYKDDFSQRIRMFLKVEDVSPAGIKLSMVYRGDDPIKDQRSIEKLYMLQKDTTKQLTLSKERLISAFRPESANADNGTPLKINGEEYVVSEIKHCFAANIKLEYAKIDDNRLVLALRNIGWQASLLNISVLEGDVKISSKLPLMFYANSYQPNMLYGEVKATGEAFKMNLTVADSSGGRQIYQLSGMRDNSKPAFILKLK